jgi:hypothetical protein
MKNGVKKMDESDWDSLMEEDRKEALGGFDLE